MASSLAGRKRRGWFLYRCERIVETAPGGHRPARDRARLRFVRRTVANSGGSMRIEEPADGGIVVVEIRLPATDPSERGGFRRPSSYIGSSARNCARENSVEGSSM